MFQNNEKNSHLEDISIQNLQSPTSAKTDLGFLCYHHGLLKSNAL